MGIFDSFKQANAESPGRVMMMQLQSAQQKMGIMNEAMRGQVLADFFHRRENIIPRLSNMTTEGAQKTGKDFQIAGNKLIRTSPVDGYPLLLVGMWLESGYRPGESAAAVHHFLDTVAMDMGGMSSLC
jgi:hypothetical protein